MNFTANYMQYVHVWLRMTDDKYYILAVGFVNYTFPHTSIRAIMVSVTVIRNVY